MTEYEAREALTSILIPGFEFIEDTNDFYYKVLVNSGGPALWDTRNSRWDLRIEDLIRDYYLRWFREERNPKHEWIKKFIEDNSIPVYPFKSLP